jgi:AcrR family transcriptional regulator
MQDIARSAGMSVGNFYRYFPSKAAMVEALITADMEEMERDFAQILNAYDPMQALREVIRYRLSDDENCIDDGRVWAEITAAALRKPEIAAITAKMESTITENLCSVFARVANLSQQEALQRCGAQALFIVMMVKTASTTERETCPRHNELMMLVQRTIDQTLDEILDMKKGHDDAR